MLLTAEHIANSIRESPADAEATEAADLSFENLSTAVTAEAVSAARAAMAGLVHSLIGSNAS